LSSNNPDDNTSDNTPDNTPDNAPDNASATTEYRRILLDGAVVRVVRDGDELVAGDGRRVRVDAAVHLPPVEPTKILAVHLNHISRVREFQATLPPAPYWFHKPTSALNAHRGAVVRPLGCSWLNYEGEVAIVIGRTARNVSPEQAADHIAGYTVANDFGLHDFRDTDAGSMLRVKGSDTLAPLGPGLVTGWDFHDKQLQTRVNGAVVQDGSTAEMTWDMYYLVADVARTITLFPGDVILSGTPANSRTVYPGDVVEVEVEGLGTLTNHIVEGPTAIRTDVGAQPTQSEEVLSTALGGDWEFRGIRAPRRP
jgi:5-oxopent-3-ene-1,2,5-tricarboxylate decarboxylase/2-hydroxyhepta-2,4-diene-1,7-dioate isomerase